MKYSQVLHNLHLVWDSISSLLFFIVVLATQTGMLNMACYLCLEPDTNT